MKIYWSDLFEDYIFGVAGVAWVLIHTSSVNRALYEWVPLPIDTEKLTLVCEV